MLASDSVLGHVGVDHWPCLEKELPQQRLTHFLVQTAHVHRGILIPFGDRSGSHGEGAPAVSKQQHRPLTSVTTSTSGPRLTLGGAGAGGGGGAGSDRGHLRGRSLVFRKGKAL